MDRLWFGLLGVCLLVALGGCHPESLDIQITVMSTAEPPPIIATALAQGASAPTIASLIQEEGLTAEAIPLPTEPAAPKPTLPSYEGTPTPDPPHAGSGGELLGGQHIVSAGETLSTIAQQYGLSLSELMQLNGLSENDVIFAGQQLTVSASVPTVTIVGPEVKLVPDSEIVYGPSARNFDVDHFLSFYNSYLLSYRDTVEGQILSGPEVVKLVAVRFGVNPRLLLAMLEYRTGWVTQPAPSVGGDYFMGQVQAGYEGLYQQLGWAANEVNLGYYGRAEGGLTGVVFADGRGVSFHPQINHGTAGIQQWLAAHANASYDRWLRETSLSGFYTTYNRLFGNPFAYTVDPLWAADLQQPQLALPWEEGAAWYYTGGPHGGWAAGSGWAALDFAPDKDLRGCYVSQAWLTAAADGVVVYSHMGGLLLDLDGDGYLGTGWVLVYWHIDSSERVPVGTVVSQGDRLGHPSCEGGYSNGTHVHFARRYNGRWVSADGNIPFNLDGWVSSGLGREYDGLLVRDGIQKEACVCAEEINELVK